MNKSNQFDEMPSASIPYEAKRLRRIAANKQKLQELDIAKLLNASPVQIAKKPRTNEENLRKKTRRSLRQLKMKQKNQHEHLTAESTECMNERSKDCIQLRQQVEQHSKKQTETVDTCKRMMIKKEDYEWKRAGDALQHSCSGGLIGDQRHDDEQSRRWDWRYRNKVQAREEMRKMTRKKREEKKARRLKEKLKMEKMKLRERKIRRRQQEKDKFEKNVQKELALQRRMEEGKLMREEDRLARKVAKQLVDEEKKKKMQEKKAWVTEWLEKLVDGKQQLTRKQEDVLNEAIYPVRRIGLPFVQISDSMESYKTKPLVLTSLLSVDVDLFHVFSLGKQFLPPGKKSVMQGLCPGGFMPVFHDHVDIHVWKNAMTLFVSGTTGLFYHYMFEEAMHDGRKYVFFQWTCSKEVTPPILWRMCHVRKGEKLLQFNTSYNDASLPTQNPESLLLFIQYPKGPYIYCGRLGYLGHHSNPLEFRFQLLDSDALNWRRICTLLTSC